MKLFGRKKTETRAAEIAVQDDELRRLLIDPEHLTVEHALSIPALASCVNFVSGIIAMLPIKLYKESADRKNTEEITTDIRLKLLNDETGDLMDAYQAKKAFIRDYLLSGSAFMYVNKTRNSVKSLHYIEKRRIGVYISADPIFKEARVFVNGKQYMPHDFLIMARNSKDGITGRGVVDESNKILSAVYNAIMYETKVLGNGGSLKGFLQSDHKLGDKEMDDLRAKWEELYSSYGNSVMILNNGIKFVEGSNSAVEMQLFENKKENNENICSLFNLSMAVVSGTADAQQNADAVKTALLPIIYELQTAMNRAFLLEDEKPDTYFALDTTELLKGDILKRYQAYQVGLAANFLQPDEVRYKEDLAPLGLDFIKLGLNDVLFNPKTGEVYTPNTNQTTNISGKPLTNKENKSIIESEKRYNENHDDLGRFCSGGGSAPKKIKSITFNDDGTETVVYKKTEAAKNPHGGNIIRNGVTYDPDGKAFAYPSIQLENHEYRKVISEINTYFYSKYEGKRFGRHDTVENAYYFEIHGFDNYNIYKKV